MLIVRRVWAGLPPAEAASRQGRKRTSSFRGRFGHLGRQLVRRPGSYWTSVRTLSRLENNAGPGGVRG